MASTTACPTMNTTTGCPRPSASYPFEPTGTFNGTALPPAWINTPFAPAGLEAPFFPPTKTYSSIFNKDTVVPPCPPTMMPTPVPVPVAMPPMAPYTMPVPVPAMTPVTGYPTTWAPLSHFNMPTYAPWATIPRECPVTGVPATWLPWMNTWCPPTTFGPISPFATRSTVYPSTVYPTVHSRNAEWINSWVDRINNTVDNLCSIAFRPSNTVELYCLTNPIRICDREGNRILCLNFDLRGYKPEEVTVTLNKAERCIVVEAAHEAKEGKEHHILRKFCRKFVLPESLAKIDLAKCEIKSCLTTEGCLCIEMPLPKLTIEEINKCPIMSKDYTSAPFGLLSCDYTNTTPITCKVN